MKFVSLFAGIGGFDLALNRLGHVCVWANEWDKYAGIIYNKRFGGVANDKVGGTRAFTNIDARDIKTVPTEEIPDHDLLVGGFPCQAFSIAGKRRGFDDTRGTLFFEIARILKDKQPKFFILENVKGLLSHDNGNTFKTIISTLTELGYDLEWQVLNSKNFGVPQNRERVFIVGHLRGERRPEVFPITESNTKDIEQLNNPRHSNDRIYGEAGISPTLNTMQGGRRQPFIADKNIDGKVYSYPYSPPLRTSASNYNMSVHGWGAIRRLTPTECERLQGFPDGWTEMGLSSIMEICVNMSPAIEKQLLKSDIAYSITKDGSVMELLSYPNGLKSNVSIVVGEPLPVSSVIDTISHGNAMAMLCSQNEILRNVDEIKRNLTLEETEGKSTKMLLNLYLEGNWNEGKLSTILTLIKETIASPTSMFAKIDENTIGVIIHLKKRESNFLKEASFGLRMANMFPISDTQRYKCLGNAVTVNVVYEIARRLNK